VAAAATGFAVAAGRDSSQATGKYRVTHESTNEVLDVGIGGKFG